MGSAKDINTAGRVRLNKATVSSLELPPGKSDYTFYDVELPGFGLRMRAKGGRTWVVVYREGRNSIRRVLGSASVVKPEEAREAARREIAQSDLGHDPATKRKEEKKRDAYTLRLVINAYIAEHVEAKQKERTKIETKRHLETHWEPLHAIPLHKTSRLDISKRLSALATKNGPVAANRARACLSALFQWAIHRGYGIESNPVQNTPKPGKEKPRERVLSPSELRAIWGATAEPTDYYMIVRLLLLTGQRREEIGGMLRSEIDSSDPRGAVLRLPSERTNAQPHDVPLSAASLAALARHLEPEPGSADRRLKSDRRPFVFGRGQGGYSGWSRSKARLDGAIARANAKAAGRVEPTEADQLKPWTLHDLRRTMTTVMNEHGLAQHNIVEAVTNHISGHKAGVAGVYNRATYAAEKRAALERWAAWLMEAVGEGDGAGSDAAAAGGNVVS